MQDSNIFELQSMMITIQEEQKNFEIAGFGSYAG